MLPDIIWKEIHDNFLNIRFLGAIAVSLVLIVSSVAVLSRSHEVLVRDYRNGVQQQEEFIDHFAHRNRLGWMAQLKREPPHLQALAVGIDAEARQDNFISNPLPVLLSRLDVVTIVSIIMSLIAVLFSYNAICGEREAGLLRQMLAAGVSRRTLLIGKYLGGLISLAIPFTISLLAGMLFLALDPGLQLHPVDFAVFAVLVIASWLYVSAFFGIGMVFSSRSHSSGQAILTSLFAWVLLVLVIPNVSPFLAAELYRVPSAAKRSQDVFQIVDRERDAIIVKRNRELIASRYPDLADLVDLPQSTLQGRLTGNPALHGRFTQYIQDRDELYAVVNREQRAKADKIDADFQQKTDDQERLARLITSASPYSNFIFIATDLTETGIAGEARWRTQADDYSNSLAGFADIRYKRELEKNPAYSFNDYLDVRDRPRFAYTPAGLGARIGPDLPQWGILAAFTLMFFMVAYVSFQRYDVR